MNTTIDELAREKRERDFLEIINRENDVPPFRQFESVEEVMTEHDHTMGRDDDGCATCQLLLEWGFLSEFYPEPESVPGIQFTGDYRDYE